MVTESFGSVKPHTLSWWIPSKLLILISWKYLLFSVGVGRLWICRMSHILNAHLSPLGDYSCVSLSG